MTTAADLRAYADRFNETGLRLDSLYAELTYCFPESERWVEVSRQIDQAWTDRRQVSVEWKAAMRGESG